MAGSGDLAWNLGSQVLPAPPTRPLGPVSRASPPARVAVWAVVPRVPVLAGPNRAVDVAGNDGQAALPEQSSKGTPLSQRCTQTNSAPPAFLPSARDPFVPGRLWVTNPPSATTSRRSLRGKRQGSDGPPLGRVALPLGSSTCTPSGDTKIACVEVALPANRTQPITLPALGAT